MGQCVPPSVHTILRLRHGKGCSIVCGAVKRATSSASGQDTWSPMGRKVTILDICGSSSIGAFIPGVDSSLGSTKAGFEGPNPAEVMVYWPSSGQRPSMRTLKSDESPAPCSLRLVGTLFQHHHFCKIGLKHRDLTTGPLSGRHEFPNQALQPGQSGWR